MATIEVNGNKVTTITHLRSDVDGLYKESTERLTETFDSIEVKQVHGKELAIARRGNESTIYNLSDNCRVCNKVLDGEEINYYQVLDDLFVKLATPDKQRIFDQWGNLLIESAKFNLSVEFGGCGPVVRGELPSGEKKNIFSLDA